MLNDKELGILSSIYEQKSKITITELANIHKLSDRSIRNYVGRINNNFNFELITLKKGLYEVSDTVFLEEFLENYQVSNYSAQALVLFMLHKLVLENKINLTHFVVEFEVSRTTAKNYLNQVKEQLEEYQLKVEHSTGIILLGKESDKRRLILNLLLHISQRDRVEQELIRPLFTELEDAQRKSVLETFLCDMLATLDYTLSEHSHQILLSYLMIMCCRCESGYDLSGVHNHGFLLQSEEYQQTKEIFSDLEEKFSYPLPEEEFLGVINMVMGLHYSKNKEYDQHNWFEYDLFISKMIRRFSKACGYNLVGDFQLYDNMLNHIKPAMYRITNHIKLHQFDYDYIISQSQREFEITAEILKELHFFPTEDILQYRDEISLISVYFRQALDKRQAEAEQNVLLVSNYGYGSTRMIMEKISSLYQVGEMDWVSSHELKQKDLSHFHLLITTDPQIEQEDVLPVLTISPFFQQEDRLLLSNYLSPREIAKINLSELLEIVENHGEIKDQQKLASDLLERFSPAVHDDRKNQKSILKFMSEDSILLDYAASNIADILEKAGGLLESGGYIQSSYTRDLIESFENYGVYMIIDADVAIPHTKNLGNVKKTGFSFIRLKEPILFEKHPLSIFITFCTVNNKEHLEALVQIADIMKDEILKESIQKLESAQEILEFFDRYEGTLS